MAGSNDVATSSKAVLIGAGPDRPGIVANLTDLIRRFDGNILDSTMTRLAGQFATILIVSLPDATQMSRFVSECQNAQASLGLTLTAQPLDERQIQQAAEESSQPFLLTVAGRDRTGITYQMATVLAEYQANITDLNAHTIEGEEGPVYVMVVEVDVPTHVAPTDLERALLQRAQELELDARFRSIEAVAL